MKLHKKGPTRTHELLKGHEASAPCCCHDTNTWENQCSLNHPELGSTRTQKYESEVEEIVDLLENDRSRGHQHSFTLAHTTLLYTYTHNTLLPLHAQHSFTLARTTLFYPCTHNTLLPLHAQHSFTLARTTCCSEEPG